MCIFCVAPEKHVIDYKNTRLLSQFLNDEGGIKKGRQSGTCRRHQNELAAEIKRAREIALLPYQTD
ncbi:MAG: 30S ribosomal protein S18 [Armatimonadota bacterium]